MIEGSHDFAESGMDIEQGCYTICSCGWRSSWTSTLPEAHDELARHWGGVSGLRADALRREPARASDGRA